MPSKVMLYDKHGNLKALDEILQLGGEGSVVMLSHFEYEIHQGKAFTFQAVDATLGDSETIVIAFKTGSSVKVHLVAGFSTLVGGYGEIWEGPTWTTNTGTATSVINRRRQGTVARCTLLEDKTATPAFTATEKVLVGNVTSMTLSTANATCIWKRYAWGLTARFEGGEYRSTNEFTLKKSTTYAVVFTAVGASNKAQIILNWIEGTFRKGGD